MDTRKLLAFGLIVLGLIGASSMASAITITDGNDNVTFSGEILTITEWENCSLNFNYLWISNGSNAVEAFIGTNGSDTLTSGADITNNLSASCVYNLNTSQLLSNGYISYAITLVGSSVQSSPTINVTTQSALINYWNLDNYTVTVSPNSTYGAIAGDNVTVTITVNGSSPAWKREGASFNVATTETGAAVTKVTDSGDPDGIQTYKIAPTTTANESLTINVTNGLAIQTGTYNVRSLLLLGDDRLISTSSDTITLKTVNSSGLLAPYNTALVCNITLPGTVDDNWNNTAALKTMNVTFAAASNNTTSGSNLNVSSVTGERTITANCSGFAVVTGTYTVTSTNLSITSIKTNNTVVETAYMQQNLTITGWSSNGASPITINISQPNGTAIVSTKVTPAANGTWTYQLNSTDVWPLASTSTLPTGVYTIFVNSTANNTVNASTTLTMANTLNVSSATSAYGSTNLTDEVYVDRNITIVGGSSRLTGSNITINISSPTAKYNTSTSVLVTAATMDTTGTNGTFTLVWNTSVVNNTEVGDYVFTIYDNVTTVTKTVTIRDNLTMNDLTTAAVNASINISGTSTRTDGSLIIITVKDETGIVTVWSNHTAVNNGTWTISFPTNQSNGGTDYSIGDSFTVLVNDSLTTQTDTLTLTDATVSLGVSESTIYVDKQLNISGTTTYPENTAVVIQVTSCANTSIVIYQNTTTVNSTNGFATNWTAANNASWIKNSTGIAYNTPGTVCVMVNISGKTDSETVYLVDSLSLTTNSGAVTGDLFLLTGASTRANGTALTINVTKGFYVVSVNAMVSNNDSVYANGNFINNTYYATDTGAQGGTALPEGTYIITVGDNIVSATATFDVVSTGVIAITSPTTDLAISIGSVFTITGTSNRANNTNVTVQIVGPSGSPALNTTTFLTNTSASGAWSYNWTTTGFTAGEYTMIVSHTQYSTESAVVVFTLTTATTTTTTTSEGQTTTTTLPGACTMPGNYEPCDAVTLSEVVSAVNAWSEGTMALADVIDLINSWSDSTTYPPN